MENMKQPNLDDRVKTEDVMNTKGLTFKSFGLSEEVQFVSIIHGLPVKFEESLSRF